MLNIVSGISDMFTVFYIVLLKDSERLCRKTHLLPLRSILMYDRMTAEVEQLLQTFEDFRSFVETDDVDSLELQIFVATVRSPWSPTAKHCQVRELDVEIKIEKE